LLITSIWKNPFEQLARDFFSRHSAKIHTGNEIIKKDDCEGGDGSFAYTGGEAWRA
jgi:hypothetical protein